MPVPLAVTRATKGVSFLPPQGPSVTWAVRVILLVITDRLVAPGLDPGWCRPQACRPSRQNAAVDDLEAYWGAVAQVVLALVLEGESSPTPGRLELGPEGPNNLTRLTGLD